MNKLWWQIAQQEYSPEKQLGRFKDALSVEIDSDERDFLRAWISYLTNGESKQYNPYKKGGFGKFNYQASLSGFHNPRKHKGMTVKAFYDLYMKRLKHKPGKQEMYAYLSTNQVEVISFIQRAFARTLRR